jgi:hypothetical protein
MGALAAEVPVTLADLGHRRVDVVERHAGIVDRLQQLELGPLRGAVVGGRAEVVALALGRPELVEEFLVGSDAGEVDLDAGRFLEGAGEALRQVVRPHDDVDLAGGAGPADEERSGDGDRAGSGAGLQQDAAVEAPGGQQRAIRRAGFACQSGHWWYLPLR